MMETLLKAVKDEIESSFTIEEIKAFKDFDKFWEEVDTQNFYEEEWKTWKKKGIKEIYRKIYIELKGP